MKKVILVGLAVLTVVFGAGYWYINNSANTKAKGVIDDALFEHFFDNNFYYQKINTNIFSKTLTIKDIEIESIKNIPEIVNSLSRVGREDFFSNKTVDINDFRTWLVADENDAIYYNIKINEIQVHSGNSKNYKVNLNGISASPDFYMGSNKVSSQFIMPLGYNIFVTDLIFEFSCADRVCEAQVYEATDDLNELRFKVQLTSITERDLDNFLNTYDFEVFEDIGIKSFEIWMKDKGIHNKWVALMEYANTVVPGEKGSFDIEKYKKENAINIADVMNMMKFFGVEVSENDIENLQTSANQAANDGGEFRVNVSFSNPLYLSRQNKRIRVKIESSGG